MDADDVSLNIIVIVIMQGYTKALGDGKFYLI